MHRKLPLIIVLLLTGLVTYGQTIVSTDPENKKVILEEFTGINCVWCPDGHVIAQNIQNNNPGDVFLINIHTGGFANPGAGQPDFRTPFGSAIAGQSGLVGYPAGTVNRHHFPGQAQNGGSGTAMSRNQWNSAANQTMGEASYMNMAVEADIDVQTNEMTVHVEAYYTGNSPESTNKLNVALLQNNTLGPQTGGNMGNEYVHQHRLVHMVTGQWGEVINTTTQGSLVDRTYNYTIPADYNGIPVELSDLEVVVFMTETNQEIISGNGSYPTYSNFAHDNDATARWVADIDDQCGFDLGPVVNIQNTGNDDITSLEITYSINGGTPASHTWTGTLSSLQNVDVELPAIAYDVQETNTVSISLESDDDSSNNDASVDFARTFIASNEINLILNTDNQGSQCTWEITNVSGTVVASGGPYGNNENISEQFDLAGDCYEFAIYDAGGNGGGSVVLYDGNGETIWSSSGDYGDGAAAFFSTDGFLGITNMPLENLSVYPNPAKGMINIAQAENATVAIYDISGRRVLQAQEISNNQQMDVSALVSGTYFVEVDLEGDRSVKKIVIAN